MTEESALDEPCLGTCNGGDDFTSQEQQFPVGYPTSDEMMVNDILTVSVMLYLGKSYISCEWLVHINIAKNAFFFLLNSA